MAQNKTKLRLLVSLSGAHGAFNPGDEYECGEHEAERLVAAEYAERLTPAPAPRANRETAVKTRPAAETLEAAAKPSLGDKIKQAVKSVTG